MSTLSVSGTTNTTGNLRDLDAKRLWSASAPVETRSAWKRGDHAEAWAALIESFGNDFPRKQVALGWGLAPEEADRFTAWQADALRRAPGVSAAWLDAFDEREASVAFAFEAIAWAGSLRGLAGKLGSEAWWSLAEALIALADESASVTAPDPAEVEATVVAQLLAGELPLVLSQTLPELRSAQALGPVSHATLSEGLQRLTDGEGLLAAPLWTDPTTPGAALLFASWTRCRMSTGTGKPPWDRGAQLQYEWLVRQSLRLSDRAGRLVMGCGGPVLEAIREGVRLAGDASDRAAAGARLKGTKGDTGFEPPASANHSEWAAVGVLAAGWHDKAPRIVVAHPADTMRVEVHAGKQTLLGGDWPVEATIAGEPVRSADSWETQCWYSDDDCDYLELALELAGGAKLERQFFLSREDGVGFLAETLFADKEAPQAITSRLDLGEGVSIRPERETRDALLTAGGKPVAGLLPLSLAEWRDDPRGGELTAEEGKLVLTRERAGRNTASFLWIDFSPKRFAKQCTWRQLAVAESLKNMPVDVAIGYRIQAAKKQWLIYRSLDPQGNRTVLGQNYSSEQIVGKFVAETGTVEEYFEIEGSED